MEKKTAKFELSSKDLKIKKLLEGEFLEVEIRAISSAYPNRNGSHFTKESLERAIPNCRNKPIVGSFDVNSDDFGGHDTTPAYDKDYDIEFEDNTPVGSEVPIGIIRESDRIRVVDDPFTGESWLIINCALWVNYAYRQVKRILKSGKKKISVEVEFTDWFVDDEGIIVVNDFNLLGIAVLSDKLETGIRSAELNVLDLIESSLFQKQTRSLTMAYAKLDEKTKNTNLQKAKSIKKNESASVNNKVSDDVSDNNIPQKVADAIGLNPPLENEKVSEISMEENSQEKECNMKKDIQENTQAFTEDEKFVEAPQGPDGNLNVSGNMSEEDKCPDCGKPKSECSCKKENEACDDKDEKECGNMSCDDKKEDESCEDKKEDECGKMSSDEKECNMAKEDECGKMSCDDDCDGKDDHDDEDDKKKEDESCGSKETESCEDKKETESCKEDECGKMSCDDKTESECGDKMDCHGPMVIELCGQKFTFEALADAYKELNEKYSEATKTINSYAQKEYVNKAFAIVDAEDTLSAESKNSLKNKINEFSETQKFSDENQATEYAENLVAHAVYAEIKAKKNSTKENKDFAVNINAEKVVIAHSDNDIDSLRNSINALKKI